MKYTTPTQHRIRASVAMMALLLLAMQASAGAAHAQDTATGTATAKTTQATASAQLEALKARLATKVAELRSVVKRAMTGTVKSVSLTSATIETKTKDIKIELTDDVVVSQILGGKRVVLPIEKVEVKDPITVFGTYDETLDLLKAQYIFIESAAKTTHVAGVIADVDTEDFTLTINTKEGRTVTIDIEKSTKTTVWTATGGIAKGGFTKLAVGDTVHVTGTPAAKAENRMTALRILDIGNVTGAVGTPSTTAAVTPVASPSATPKVTPKPTATPKPTP